MVGLERIELSSGGYKPPALTIVRQTYGFLAMASSLGLEPRIKAPETLVLPITPRGNKSEFLTPKSANDLFA